MDSLLVETVPLEHELFILTLKELLPSLNRCTDKQIVTRFGKGKFEDAVQYTFDYIERSCGKNSRNESLAILSQVFKCLCTYIREEEHLPVTPKTIFDGIYMLEYAVENSFPGYASAGLLKAIISPAALPQALRIAS